MKYEIIRRTLLSIKKEELPETVVDPAGLAALPGETLKCFNHCPYAEGSDYNWQYLATVDDVVAGHLGIFPIRLKCNQSIKSAISGSDLYIDEKYRKFGIGLSLLEDFFDDIANDIFVVYGISAMAEPVYKFCRTAMAKIPVCTMLIRSSVKLAFVCGGRLRWLAPVADILLRAYHFLLKCRISSLSRYKVVECSKIPDGVNEIVAADKHMYAEWHGAEYLQWLKDNPMYSAPDSRRFYALYEGEEMVGFYMTGESEQIITCRGKKISYKRGSVLEWGTKCNKRLPEKFLLLQALLSFKNRVHVARVHTIEPELIDFLTFTCAMRKSDEYNWGVKIGKESPFAQMPGITDVSNWRIRTAMGDVGFL